MKCLLRVVGADALPAFAADMQTRYLTIGSFWLVTAAMLAAAVFILCERDKVPGKENTT